ncbi:tryptophan dimethylallyltransferase-domain-containing protein [Aspergillus alliaceus]|uniref:Tryptophan dimethylallyltransferase-domain-containing protein n=1 Tax=Petromyces alliaceus TaxID=209559 RepID=A0A5N7C849_PETAA|nr:tryptophan dimethylallyltransferase-domain-containing protein [Aspergillus alliaceus]
MAAITKPHRSLLVAANRSASVLHAGGSRVPYMGPAPGPEGSLKWKSLLGVEGSPIEYSWKWNTATGKPDVRYTIEAIGPWRATDLDPLKQQATLEMLYRIADVVSSVDLT